jgi:hypothetical protein
LHDIKRAETHQAYIATSLQRARNRIECAVHCFRGISLRKASPGSNRRYEIIFVHLQPPHILLKNLVRA